MKIVENEEMWLLHRFTRLQLDISSRLWVIMVRKVANRTHTYIHPDASWKSYFSTFQTILSTLTVISRIFSYKITAQNRWKIEIWLWFNLEPRILKALHRCILHFIHNFNYNYFTALHIIRIQINNNYLNLP